MEEAETGGYTVLNLEEVEDSAPKAGLAPAVEARFAREDLGLERGLAFIVFGAPYNGPGYAELIPGWWSS